VEVGPEWNREVEADGGGVGKGRIYSIPCDERNTNTLDSEPQRCESGTFMHLQRPPREGHWNLITYKALINQC